MKGSFLATESNNQTWIEGLKENVGKEKFTIDTCLKYFPSLSIREIQLRLKKAIDE